jgi:hypothetical protein
MKYFFNRKDWITKYGWFEHEAIELGLIHDSVFK